ncbi:MAG: class I SAM-dependent methyltransferase [Succinivibrio sp.]
MIDKHESITAKICSFVRAYHSIYSHQKIFDDALAYDLMEQREYIRIGQLIEHDFDEGRYDESVVFDRSVVDKKVNAFLAPIPLSRIAYTESALDKFAREEGSVQYVILGAGLDTFSFRNTNRNIDVFELDHPDTGRYKKSKVHDLEWVIPANVHFIGIDFNKDNLVDVLLKSGFKKDKPAFFAILGVTYYLTLGVFENTLKMIDELTDSTAEVVFDYPDETTFSLDKDSRVTKLARMTALLGEDMAYGYSFEEIKKALLQHGFAVREHLSPDAIDELYFKDRKDGQRAYENVHLITGLKKGSK